MRLGIFAKTFVRPALEETLDAVVAHGLTQVQFNMSCLGLATLPDRLDQSSCIWIARSLSERGLTMAAISGTFNLCDPRPDLLAHNLRNLDVLAAACRWLDTRIITLCTGTRDPKDMWRWHHDNVKRTTWASLVDATKAACAIADRHEVILAFEPELHNVVNSVAKARRLLDEVNSPWLKVVLDPANLLVPGQSRRMDDSVRVTFDEAFDWLGSDIVLVHAKDPAFGTRADSGQSLQLSGESAIELQPAEVRYHVALPKEFEALDDVYSHAPAKQQFLPDYVAFYTRYFHGLRQLGYGGAIVIHGLAENEVAGRRKLLNHVMERIAE